MIKELVNGFRLTGKAVGMGGLFCLFLMSIVGTISVDIVILFFLLKEMKNKNNDSFLTGFLFGCLWSRPSPVIIHEPCSHRHHHHHSYADSESDLFIQAAILVAVSLIITAIAIGLSFYLGVGSVGIGLALGWGLAISIVALGGLIHGIGDAIEYGFDRRTVVEAASPGLQFQSSYSYAQASAPSLMKKKVVEAFPIPVMSTANPSDVRVSGLSMYPAPVNESDMRNKKSSEFYQSMMNSGQSV